MTRLRDANAFLLCERERAHRPVPRVFDLALVGCDQCGGQLRDGLRPLATELLVDRKVRRPVASRKLPVSRSPLQHAQVPERFCLRGIVPRVQRRAQPIGQLPGAFELPRPEELVKEDPHGGACGRRLRQGPLQCERFIHTFVCNASAGAKVEEAKRRQCLAPQRGVAS